MSDFFPSEIEDVQTACALRFDGYLYQEKTGIEFPDLNKPIKATRRMYKDPLKNFAVFFALQRFLCKWGGEQLTKQSPEHMAYDFLYLQLYQIETPVEYAYAEFAERWKLIADDQREDTAQFIRNSLSRKD